MSVRLNRPFLAVVYAPFVARVLPLAAQAPAAVPAGIEIPYQKFVLPNGLTLIVHEDHKAPIVAVNVW